MGLISSRFRTPGVTKRPQIKPKKIENSTKCLHFYTEMLQKTSSSMSNWIKAKNGFSLSKHSESREFLGLFFRETWLIFKPLFLRDSEFLVMLIDFQQVKNNLYPTWKIQKKYCVGGEKKSFRKAFVRHKTCGYWLSSPMLHRSFVKRGSSH